MWQLRCDATSAQHRAMRLFSALTEHTRSKFEVGQHYQLLSSFLLLTPYFMLWSFTFDLEICSVSPVTWRNSVPNLSKVELSSAELLRS